MDTGAMKNWYMTLVCADYDDAVKGMSRVEKFKSGLIFRTLFKGVSFEPTGKKKTFEDSDSIAFEFKCFGYAPKILNLWRLLNGWVLRDTCVMLPMGSIEELDKPQV